MTFTTMWYIPNMLYAQLSDVMPSFQAKLQKRLDSVTFPVLNEPREGKKCAVFDIDHTLFALG